MNRFNSSQQQSELVLVSLASVGAKMFFARRLGI